MRFQNLLTPRRLAAAGLLATALGGTNAMAQQKDIYWHVGVHQPGVSVNLSNSPGVAVVAAPAYYPGYGPAYGPTYYPGYYPPVIHPRPVVVVPAPVVYRAAAPVYYTDSHRHGRGHGYGHYKHRGHRHDRDHGRGDDHDRGDRDGHGRR